MEWSEQFPMEIKPDIDQIGEYIHHPLWGELCRYVEKEFGVEPRIEYSCCSMQRGWNVKYKKGSKPICTLYPGEGFYICLVSVSGKDAQEAEHMLGMCTPYLQELYWNTNLFNGGRWLMVQVTDPDILEDVKALIALRMKKRTK